MTAVQANAPSEIIRGPSVVLLCFCFQMGRAEGQPPVITEQPQMLPAAAGQRVTALVSASGSGPISYQWRRDGTPISNSLRTSGAMTFMLEIEPVRAEDAGTYDVVATSSAGSVASNAVELVVESCGLDWSPEFCLQGVNNYIGGPIKLHTVRTGPLNGVYAAGSFFEVGGQPARGLARWVDRRWATPGGWFADRMGIAALHEYDAGQGPQLVAGGGFVWTDGGGLNRVALWDGAFWQPLGAGFANGVVTCFAVFDAGDGPHLYAGGSMLSSGATSVNRIARWSGAQWLPLGDGVNGDVECMAVHDDGSGAALYVAGAFTIAGGQPADRIARWNGQSWSTVGLGLDATVRALTVHVADGIPVLIAGGDFGRAGSNVAVNRIACWKWQSWLAVGAGFNAPVRALASADDGDGEALFAGGDFTASGSETVNRIARWRGDAWEPLGAGVTQTVTSLAADTDERGPALFVGGYFTQSGSVFEPGLTYMKNVGRWGQGAWSSLGQGVRDVNNYYVNVYAMESFRGRLVVGGGINIAGGVRVRGLMQATDLGWSTIDSGYSGTVFDLLTRQSAGVDGMLVVCGGSQKLNEVPVESVLTWDGTTWSDLGFGNQQVESLAEFDDGAGAVLYAVGEFSSAGGAPALNIAAYANGAWSAVGAGLNRGPDPDFVRMRVCNDGDGPALYVVGDFESAGGLPETHGIARWKGGQWESVGGIGAGDYTAVFDIVEFDDGRGPALFAGGYFDQIGGVPAYNLARWDGDSWESVEGLPESVIYALAVFDDGNGPALYAAGVMTDPTWNFSECILRWDGQHWKGLGSGVNNSAYPSDYGPRILELLSFDDGTGPALWAGGHFTFAGARPSYGIAKWQRTQFVPEITQHPMGLIASVGQPVTFTVATAHTGGNIVQWMRDGAPLFDGGGVSGANTLNLTLASATPGDAGEYVASITNDCGGAESDPALLIIHAPADMNGDAMVNKQDVDLFKSCFNLPGESLTPDCYQADLNGDGLLTCADWPIFRAIWGSNQPVLLEGCTFTPTAGPMDE